MTNFCSLFYAFPFMPYDDQKKCFDHFDRVEGELRKEIHVSKPFTLLYVVLSCVKVIFHE